MPKVSIYDMSGKSVGEMELSDGIFGVEPNEAILHDAVVNYLARQRQGTQSAKTRSEVRGGGRKPWRQKGTGNARHGSIRSPIWKGGGVTFAPKPRDYGYVMGKKVRKAAMLSAFSSKVQADEFIVVDSIACDDFKTKTIVDMLSALEAERSVMIVLADSDKKVINSARNIPNVKTANVNALNVYDILRYDKLIISKNAVEKIEEVYA